MTAENSFQVVAAADGKKIALDMQDLLVTGRILPVGTVLTVRHTFVCASRRPTEVVYAFPLPRDAAVRRFRIVTEENSTESKLEPVDQAVAEYEKGIENGSLSVLMRAYRDGLVNLSVGNVRPGETVLVLAEIVAGVDMADDGLRFRFPFTLAPGYHARIRPDVADDGAGQITLPENLFEDAILPEWRADAKGLHTVGFDIEVTAPNQIAEVASPSHKIRALPAGTDKVRVLPATEREIPNRDLVLDVHWSPAATPCLFGGLDARGRNRCAVFIPSTAFEQTTRVLPPRRIVFLLDRSGSMGGEPLEQARSGLTACLGALRAQDRFAILAFDDSSEPLTPGLVPANREERDRAATGLAAVEARGGTELAEGIRRAAEFLEEKGGDVIVFTDGQVSATEDILAIAQGAGMHLHCLGIGSASQDRFLTLLARRTGGISRFVTARERVDSAALDLFAALGTPVADGIRTTLTPATAGRVRPAPAPVVYSGRPLALFADLDRTRTAGKITVTVTGGAVGAEADAPTLDIPLPVSSELCPEAEVVRLLQGARIITDLDSEWTSEDAGEPRSRKRTARIRAALEKASREFGLASRAMALTAVMKRAGDQTGSLPETRIVPTGMPEDTPFNAYFAPGYALGAEDVQRSASDRVYCIRDTGGGLGEAGPAYAAPAGALPSAPPAGALPSAPPPDRALSSLMELAAALEPDGGMPGPDTEARLALTCIVLLAFVAAGHDEHQSPFRKHIRRLREFLESEALAVTDPGRAACLTAVTEACANSAPIDGPWLKLARNSVRKGGAKATRLWQALERRITS